MPGLFISWLAGRITPKPVDIFSWNFWKGSLGIMNDTISYVFRFKCVKSCCRLVSYCVWWAILSFSWVRIGYGQQICFGLVSVKQNAAKSKWLMWWVQENSMLPQLAYSFQSYIFVQFYFHNSLTLITETHLRISVYFQRLLIYRISH